MKEVSWGSFPVAVWALDELQSAIILKITKGPSSDLTLQVEGGEIRRSARSYWYAYVFYRLK